MKNLESTATNIDPSVGRQAKAVGKFHHLSSFWIELHDMSAKSKSKNFN